MAMIRERQLTSHFPPIVHAARLDQPYGYEALLRGVNPDGSFIFPAARFDTARGAGMLFQLDLAVAAIDKAGIARGQVVFKIVDTERTHDSEHLRSILDYYRGVGFLIALDDVGAGYSSLNVIHLLRPVIIELDMERVRHVDRDSHKARIAANLLDIANALGMDAFTEGIETEGELKWVQQHGAKYVQGFLIARPTPTPVTAVASRSPVQVAD